MDRQATQTIQLTDAQVKYLGDAGFLSTFQLGAIRGVVWQSPSVGTLSLSKAEAETFRDAFTEQLARVGFDASYAPTEEGKMLEDLIDRFF
jgi:hypothetical protein